MPTIMPEGESIRSAVRWISEQRQADDGQNITKLVESASMKFNLSPADAAYLMRLLKEEGGAEST